MHDDFYTREMLDLDEQGNDFSKIAPLWKETPLLLKVLDLGCGAGTVSEQLVKNGHEVHGIDIQDEAVKRACLRGLKAQVHDINNGIPFEDKIFDVVLAPDILEHLFDPQFILDELHRVLKNDGYAIVVLPLHFDIIQRLKILFGRGIVLYEHLGYSKNFRPWNYIHIRFFTLSEVYEFIDICNFVVDKKIFRALIPNPNAENKYVELLLRKIFNPFLAKSIPRLFSSGISLRLHKKIKVEKK
jgi:methionine biosynthesis protein MetW